MGGTRRSPPQIIITRGNGKANACPGRLLGNRVSHPPDDSLPPPSLSAPLSSQASGNLQTAKIVSGSKWCALERGVYLAFSALSVQITRFTQKLLFPSSTKGKCTQTSTITPERLFLARGGQNNLLGVFPFFSVGEIDSFSVYTVLQRKQ